MSSKDVDIVFTERLLVGAKDGNMDAVNYCLYNGIDIESKNEVRFNDSFNINMNMYI
jgi:hypothetical protein